MSIPSCQASLLAQSLNFERTVFPDKFNYRLTPGVIDRKLSGDRPLFRTLYCSSLLAKPHINTPFQFMTIKIGDLVGIAK